MLCVLTPEVEIAEKDLSLGLRSFIIRRTVLMKCEFCVGLTSSEISFT